MRSHTRSFATLAAQRLAHIPSASIGKGKSLNLLQELTVLITRCPCLMPVLLKVPLILVEYRGQVAALFHSCCQPLSLDPMKVLVCELDLKAHKGFMHHIISIQLITGLPSCRDVLACLFSWFRCNTHAGDARN
jgi:hypothetical protein